MGGLATGKKGVKTPSLSLVQKGALSRPAESLCLVIFIFSFLSALRSGPGLAKLRHKLSSAPLSIDRTSAVDLPQGQFVSFNTTCKHPNKSPEADEVVYCAILSCRARLPPDNADLGAVTDIIMGFATGFVRNSNDRTLFLPQRAYLQSLGRPAASL